MTKYYTVQREKDGTWSARRDWRSNYRRMTKQHFPTHQEAEQYIRKNYKASSKLDRPWIDHKIHGHSGNLMTLAEWISSVEHGGFIDYDGMGSVLDAEYNILDFHGVSYIKPSDYSKSLRVIPDEVEYVLWYNR